VQQINPSHHLISAVYVYPKRLAGSFEGHWLSALASQICVGDSKAISSKTRFTASSLCRLPRLGLPCLGSYAPRARRALRAGEGGCASGLLLPPSGFPGAKCTYLDLLVVQAVTREPPLSFCLWVLGWSTWYLCAYNPTFAPPALHCLTSVLFASPTPSPFLSLSPPLSPLLPFLFWPRLAG
jgi:hypothetical protein